MLDIIEALLPTFIAILSLVVFTKQTRKLCYATVALCTLSELIPLQLNLTALFSCAAVLTGMIVIEFLQTHHFLRMSSVIKHKH